MNRTCLSLCVFLIAALFSTNPSHADFSLLLSEEWLDDSIGAQANNTPEIGSATYSFGTHTVYDHGGGDKGVELEAGFIGGYVQYHPIPTQSVHSIQNVNYRCGVDNNVTGGQQNQVLQTISLNNDQVSLYWGNDNALRYAYIGQGVDTGIINSGVTYSRGQVYTVEFLFDYQSDSMDLLFDGQSLLSRSIGGAENNVSQVFLQMTSGVTGKTRLEYMSVGAASVPEPGSLALCAIGLVGTAIRRKRK